jgi:hypothetical protein
MIHVIAILQRLARSAAAAAWLLATGNWDDAGAWSDAATWNDGGGAPGMTGFSSGFDEGFS